MGNAYSSPPINLDNPEATATLLPSQWWLIIGGYFSIAFLLLFGIVCLFVDAGDTGNQTGSIILGVICIAIAIVCIFILRWYKKRSLNRYMGKLESHCPKEDFIQHGELNRGSYRTCLETQRQAIDNIANTTATGIAVARNIRW